MFVTCKAETPSPSVASLERVSLNNRTSSRSAEEHGQLCRVHKNIKINRYPRVCLNRETAIVLSREKLACVIKGRINQNEAVLLLNGYVVVFTMT